MTPQSSRASDLEEVYMTEQGASPNPAQAYLDHLVPAMF
jgi:hypothetical protein